MENDILKKEDDLLTNADTDSDLLTNADIDSDVFFDSNIRLNEFVKIVTKRRRDGRGHGSGGGKTCRRGVSGQKSRSGHAIDPRFCGGQSPFHKTTPKIVRMNNHAREVYEISANVMYYKCAGLETLEDAIQYLNIPFKYRFVKVIGDKSKLPFKFEEKLIKIKNGIKV